MKDPLLFIKEKLVEYFSIEQEIIDSLTVDTNLNYLGIDSLDLFNIIFAIEEEYNINIKDIFEITTVGELILEIERLRKLNGKT